MESPLQKIIDVLALQVREGMTGIQLDEQCAALIRLHNCTPAFLGYKPLNFGGETGYPNVLCVSVNNEVIHGIPSNYKFIEGDVIKLDTGIRTRDARPPF